jgi:GNAT superfamily N-acetyltransferase
MLDLLSLRLAVPGDLGALDDLLQRSYPQLLAADYPPSVMVLALPLITKARPQLLASGRYFVIEDQAGHLRGAGGYSRSAPGPDGSAADAHGRVGHIRHVATDPAFTRKGIARRIMDHVLAQARAEGLAAMECLSTRTAVPFYSAMGFNPRGAVDVTLGAGISFPAVQMDRVL